MKKRALVMLLCAVMAISSAASGTIAYLTSEAGVTNRFTVGNVSIKVDETDVSPDGTPVEGAPRVEDGNDYHLIPGRAYVKDPAVTVKKGSESSYIRMRVTISKAAALEQLLAGLKAAYPEKFPYGLPQEHVTGWDSQTWVFAGESRDEALDTVTYEFRYHDKTVADTERAQIFTLPQDADDVTLDALFDQIAVPAEVTGEQLAALAGLEIGVIGQAIQAEGFATAQEAWAAFDAQTALIPAEQALEAEGETAEGTGSEAAETAEGEKTVDEPETEEPGAVD